MMDTFEIVSATLDGASASRSMLMLSPQPQEDLSVIFLPDDISSEMLHATLSHAADWNEISIAPELVNPGFGFPANNATTVSMGSPDDTIFASATATTATTDTTDTTSYTSMTTATMNHGYGFPSTNEFMELGYMGPMRHRRRRSSGASPMMKPYGSPPSHSGILSPANLLEVVPEEIFQSTTMAPDMIQTLSQLFAPLHVMDSSNNHNHNHLFGMMAFPPLIPVTASTGIPSNGAAVGGATTSTTTSTTTTSTTATATKQNRRTSMDPTFGAMLDHQKRHRLEIEENILSVNYDDVTVTQMKKLLRQSNLPACGKKSDLMDRLRREGERLLAKQRLSLVGQQQQPMQMQQHQQHQERESVPSVVEVTPPAHKQYLKRDQLLVQPPAFLKTLDSLDAKKDVFQLMSPLAMTN